MFSFLRKTRKKLTMKSDSTKYLGYALGEIVLVVIGILIALGINNWSEGQKARQLEMEILIQISENLKKDKAALSEIIANANRAVYASEKILALHHSNRASDSLQYWLGNIVQFDRFLPLTNAYEVLKSKGLDLVSNKELRFKLGTYYDDQAKIITNANEDLKQSFVDDWLPVLKVGVVDFEFKEYVILEDEGAFIASDKIRNIMVLNRSNYTGSIQYMNSGVVLIDTILDIISREVQYQK
jgi:type II secretory pathway pseudopilin PulG